MSDKLLNVAFKKQNQTLLNLIPNRSGTVVDIEGECAHPGTRPMSGDTPVTAVGEGRAWLLAGKGGDAVRILHCPGHPHTPAPPQMPQCCRGEGSHPSGQDQAADGDCVGTSTVLRSEFSSAPTPPTRFCTWRKAAAARAQAASRPAPPQSPSPGRAQGSPAQEGGQGRGPAGPGRLSHVCLVARPPLWVRDPFPRPRGGTCARVHSHRGTTPRRHAGAGTGCSVTRRLPPAGRSPRAGEKRLHAALCGCRPDDSPRK